MITCQQLTELLMDFCSDEATPECRAAIEEHLQQCNCCVVFVQTFQITIRLTRKLPTRPMRPQFAARLLEALRQAQEDSGE